MADRSDGLPPVDCSSGVTIKALSDDIVAQVACEIRNELHGMHRGLLDDIVARVSHQIKEDLQEIREAVRWSADQLLGKMDGTLAFSRQTTPESAVSAKTPKTPRILGCENIDFSDLKLASDFTSRHDKEKPFESKGSRTPPTHATHMRTLKGMEVLIGEALIQSSIESQTPRVAVSPKREEKKRLEFDSRTSPATKEKKRSEVAFESQCLLNDKSRHEQSSNQSSSQADTDNRTYRLKRPAKIQTRCERRTLSRIEANIANELFHNYDLQKGSEGAATSARPSNSSSHSAIAAAAAAAALSASSSGAPAAALSTQQTPHTGGGTQSSPRKTGESQSPGTQAFTSVPSTGSGSARHDAHSLGSTVYRQLSSGQSNHGGEMHANGACKTDAAHFQSDGFSQNGHSCSGKDIPGHLASPKGVPGKAPQSQAAGLHQPPDAPIEDDAELQQAFSSKSLSVIPSTQPSNRRGFMARWRGPSKAEARRADRRHNSEPLPEKYNVYLPGSLTVPQAPASGMSSPTRTCPSPASGSSNALFKEENKSQFKRRPSPCSSIDVLSDKVHERRTSMSMNSFRNLYEEQLAQESQGISECRFTAAASCNLEGENGCESISENSTLEQYTTEEPSRLLRTLATPLWLRITGIMPYIKSTDRIALLHKVHFACVAFLVLLGVCFYLYELMDLVLETDEESSIERPVCGGRPCMQGWLICDLSLALGALIGIFAVQKLKRSNLLGSCDALLVAYVSNQGLLERWWNLSRVELLVMPSLWICMVFERLRSMFANVGGENLLFLPTVHMVIFAFVSCLFMAISYCLLHVCCVLEVVLDSFPLSVVESSEFVEAVRRWNVLQAVIRRASASVASTYLVLLSSAMCASLGPSMGSQPYAAIPAVFVVVAVARFSFRAGCISYKCDRVPSLINSLSFGEDLDYKRQYVVEYILHSAAGFYIFEVRITVEMVLKVAYFSGALTLAVMTKVISP